MPNTHTHIFFSSSFKIPKLQIELYLPPGKVIKL